MATKDGTAMTFTRPEVKALLDEAMRQSKNINIQNGTFVCVSFVCINNTDQSDNKKSKSNLFSKDAAEKDRFYKWRWGKFTKKVYDLLRKIFNFEPHFPKA